MQQMYSLMAIFECFFWIDGLCGIDFFFSLSNFCIGQPDFWSFMCYLGISFSVILSKSFLSFCIYSTLYKCIVILLRVLQIRLLISCCFAKEMVHPKKVDFDYVQNDQTNKHKFKYSSLWYQYAAIFVILELAVRPSSHLCCLYDKYIFTPIDVHCIYFCFLSN